MIRRAIQGRTIPPATGSTRTVMASMACAIWHHAPELAFARRRTVDNLWGFCRTCPFARVCMGGCSFTAHSVFGRPGNNPYCHFRARSFAKQGLRERLVPVTAAPGAPFDHGTFDVVIEPLDTPMPPIRRSPPSASSSSPARRAHSPIRCCASDLIWRGQHHARLRGSIHASHRARMPLTRPREVGPEAPLGLHQRREPTFAVIHRKVVTKLALQRWAHTRIYLGAAFEGRRQVPGRRRRRREITSRARRPARRRSRATGWPRSRRVPGSRPRAGRRAQARAPWVRRWAA